VGSETLQSFLSEQQRKAITDPANFCPSPQCEVVYFDCFGRVMLTGDVARPVYPKDPSAPICPCFGLTREDIERDIEEGAPTRTREVVQRAKTPAARCRQMAASGQPCVAFVQKYYMQCLAAKKS
jgi:hypothetical protein